MCALFKLIVFCHFSQAIEKCRACVDFSLNGVSSNVYVIRPWNYARSFRCILASRRVDSREFPEYPSSTVPATNNVDVDVDAGRLPVSTPWSVNLKPDFIFIHLSNFVDLRAFEYLQDITGDRNNAGFPRRIASDS